MLATMYLYIQLVQTEQIFLHYAAFHFYMRDNEGRMVMN